MKRTRLFTMLTAMLAAVVLVFTSGLSVNAAGTDVASVALADGVTVTNYTDLAEAFAAAEAAEGSTLTLLTDISTDTYVDVNSGKFTVDLNGKVWESSYWALYVDGTADVKITDTATGGTLRGTGSGVSAVNLIDTAKLEIAGGTVESTANYHAIDMMEGGNVTSSELTVSGGKVTSNGYSSINAAGASFAITDGTVEQKIFYVNGVLDLSAYTGTEVISVYIDTNVAVDTDKFKFPAGYAFHDEYDNAVSAPTAGNLYTVALVRYSVFVESENGTVEITPSGKVAPGEEVTLTVTPSDGYLFDTITATAALGDSVTVTANTFTMPASDVTVKATFKEKQAAWGTDENSLTSQGTLTEAVEAVNAGEAAYIRLLNHIYGDVLTVTGKVTLDLNGYNLDLDNGTDVALTLDGNADVTFINTNEESDSYYYVYSPVVLGENTSFSLKDVYIYVYNGSEIRYGGGKLDLTGMPGDSFVYLKNLTASDVIPGSDTVVLNDSVKAYIYDKQTDGFTVVSKLSCETEYTISRFVKITFDPNGGEGTSVTEEYPAGWWKVKAIPGFTTPEEGLVFRGWSVDSDSQYFDVEIEAYEDTTYYAIWGEPVVVGGVALKDGEYLNAKGEVTAKKPWFGGYAYYKNGVLTLHNYTYEGRGFSHDEDSHALIFVVDGTVIELSGKNVLKSDARYHGDYYYETDYEDINAIRCYGDVTIRGEGSLEASGVHDAIDVYDLTVESGTLRLTAVDNAIESDAVTVKGGTFALVSTGDEAIYADGTVLIEDGAFTLTSYYDCLYAEDNVTVKNGTFDLYSSNDYGFYVWGDLLIEDGTFTVVSDQDCLYATETMTFKGGTFNLRSNSEEGIDSESMLIEGGTFRIHADDDCIDVSKTLTVKGGTFDFLSDSDDGIDAYECVIEGGTFRIDVDEEGIEGTNLTVSGGSFDIKAGNDGFDLVEAVTVSGGTFYIQANFEGIEAVTVEISGGRFVLASDSNSVSATESIDISGRNTAIYYTNDFSSVTMDIAADDMNANAYALEGKDVKHNWSASYASDDTAHWHTCSGEACLHTDGDYALIPGSGYGLHDGSECSVCGYRAAPDREIDIYIGEFGLADGEYLTCDGKITTEAPVSGGYAYYAYGYLRLYNFVYEGNHPGEALIAYGNHLNIEAEGENVLTNSGMHGTAIEIYNGYLDIYGYTRNDVLTLNADTGIYTYNSDINVDDVTLNINAGSYGITHDCFNYYDDYEYGDAYYLDIDRNAVVNIVSRNVGISSYEYNELEISGILNIVAVLDGIQGDVHFDVIENAQIDVSGGRKAITAGDFYNEDDLAVIGGYFDGYEGEFISNKAYFPATRIRILSMNAVLDSVEESIGKLDTLVEEGGSLDEIAGAMEILNESLASLTNEAGEGRFDVIEKAVASLEAAIETINAKLSDVDTNKEDISSLNTTVAEIQGTLATLGTAAEDERLAGLITELDTSLNTLSDTLDGVAEKLAAAEEKLAATEEKITALEADVTALNRLIAEGGTVDEINAAILDINAKLSALTNEEGNGKVDAVEKAVEALEEAVETINAKLSEEDNTKESITALNTTVSAIQGTLTTLGTAAEDTRLAGLIDALDTSLDTLTDSLEAAEARVDAAEGKISELENALTEANSNLEAAEESVTALESEVNTLRGELEDANAQNKTAQTVIAIVAIVGVLGNAGVITAMVVLVRKKKTV